MKIVVFSGAGVSAESNIPTFRDEIDGLWENVNIYEVAHVDAWNTQPEKVIKFHNMVRELYGEREPNKAHNFIGELEKEHDVTVVTQNIDNLHEKGGSSNVYHLHGELNKVRCVETDELYKYDDEKVLNSHNTLKYKPHTVLFGETPHNIEESVKAISDAEMLIIIGTSFDISYILPMLAQNVGKKTPVYYIDKNCYYNLNGHFKNLTIIKEPACKGIEKLPLFNQI